MSNLGNKEIMAKNIRYYMEKRGLNATDFATTLNFKYSTVLDWLNAKTYPRIDKIEIIANYFNIEKSDLVEDKSKVKVEVTLSSEIETIYNKLEKTRQTKVLNFAKNELEEQEKTQEDEVYYNYVPFYGYASAGTGQPIYDTPIETIKVKGYVPMHDLALLTSGDSMEPLYKNGDVIFINKSPEVQNGQIGVFILDGECFVKKLRIDEDGTIRLVSLNKKYKDIIINEYSNFIVVGKVVM